MQRSDYRERLTPSLWLLVSAGVVAPMAMLVLQPFDSTLALFVGAILGIAFVAMFVVLSPTIEVNDGVLRAGRAHIEVDWLDAPVVLSGEEARQARGPGLQRDSWMLIRGGIDGLVVIPIRDPDDPVPAWVVSTRTPDRLAAAINRSRAYAQSRQISPIESS